MQTFLPEPTFERCAHVLDDKRLNKQLLEGRQILNVIINGGKGWVNHPAVNMWRGHELALYEYLYAIASELHVRGINYTKNWNAISDLKDQIGKGDVYIPIWWRNLTLRDRVMTSHRASLYNKDPMHYAQYKVDTYYAPDQVCCAGKCTYYWPTHIKD